jgi:hypothetical protein
VKYSRWSFNGFSYKIVHPIDVFGFDFCGCFGRMFAGTTQAGVKDVSGQEFGAGSVNSFEKVFGKAAGFYRIRPWESIVL